MSKVPRPSSHGQFTVVANASADAPRTNGIAPSRPSRFLTWPEVHERVRSSRTTVWRMEKDRKFPARVKISRARVGWREMEIEAYVDGSWVAPGSSE